MDLESDLQAAQLTVGMKQTSVASLTRTKASMERIAKREGEILVGIEASCEANAKFNAEQDEKMSQEMQKSCATKTKEFDERSQVRADEIQAISETIKIL